MVVAEYKVNRCTRRCCVEDRNLRDGEWYYSVVIEDGEDLIRKDYSAGAWTEPPPGTIGWWKSRMPESGARKMVPTPEPMLIEHLRRMESDPSQGPLRYLLALTLLRRRILRPFESNLDAAPAGSSKVAGMAMLRLQVASDGSEVEVLEYPITRRQADSLRDALQELLYCEATE